MIILYYGAIPGHSLPFRSFTDHSIPGIYKETGSIKYGVKYYIKIPIIKEPKQVNLYQDEKDLLDIIIIL